MADDFNRTSHTRRETILQITAAAAALGAARVSKAATLAAPQGKRATAALTSRLAAQGIDVILPGEPSYDEARTVFDLRADKKPAVILQCASVAHVQAALKFAQEQHLPFAIRSGGHGFANRSTIDAGVLIDLAPMNDVKLDAVAKTVTLGPGVRTGQLLAVTVPQGLAPVTTCSAHVGVVGAAIFAGEGQLSSIHGYMCDTVLSFDVVLASGHLITVSANDHPDLFWAMRGAGDSFGVVTSMTMRVFDIPASVQTCFLEYDADEHGKQIMQSYRDYEWASPPPFVFGTLRFDEKAKKPRVNYLFALFGDEQQAARDIAAVDKFGTPLVRTITKMDWQELHTVMNFPSSRFYLAHKELCGGPTGLDDETLDLLLDETRRIGADSLASTPVDGLPVRELSFKPRKGAMLGQGPSPTAYNVRAGGDIEVVAQWSDASKDAQYQNWAEGVVERLYKAGKADKPFTLANSTVDEKLTRECFGKDYQRLVEIKRKYDPGNVFKYSTSVIRI